MRSLLLLSAASAAVAYPNGAPNARLPTLGWSSWIALGPDGQAPVFDFCDEQSVKASADAFIALGESSAKPAPPPLRGPARTPRLLAPLRQTRTNRSMKIHSGGARHAGLYDAGYRHFHLDDCWATTQRDANNNTYAELDHFPNGLKPVIDYVHSKGLSFGLYTCGGTKTCVGNRVGSMGFWQKDADSYASWGVDWVKMDWCNNQGQEPKVAYASMSAALNNTGRPIAFNMCEWGVEDPWNWGDNIAQSWRMAGDHTGNWDSTKSVIRSSAAIPANASGRPYGWNDMDMLETGCGAQCAHANGRQPNMTDIEWKTEFSMWAISASPLQFTAPLMNCTAAPPAPRPSCAVSLLAQHSQAACTLGASFGCDAGDASNNTMFTDAGCRGDFLCNGANVTCDVDGAGRHSCACASGGAPVCTPWLSDLQKTILLNKEVIAIK